MSETEAFNGIDWHNAQTLSAFLAGISPLSLIDKRTIIDAAASVLADHYAHLPHKRSAHGVDPVARLRALARSLEDLATETGFHAELVQIFAELRDLHTVYTLPTPFAGMVAFLPFQVGIAHAGDLRQVIVTHVMPGCVHAPFAAGVEITAWNGIPVWRAIEKLAASTGGANRAASQARAVAAFTQRPMMRLAPPDEMHIEVEYQTETGERHRTRLDWKICKLVADTHVAHKPAAPAHPHCLTLALDDMGDALRRHRKSAFAPHVLHAETHGVPVAHDGFHDAHPHEEEVPTRLSQVRAWKGMFEGRPFGHLRIRSFNTRDPDGFLDDMAMLLERLPQDGLIIDVRDNPGGLMAAAERMLQFFSDRPIQPVRMEFLATEANLRLCQSQTPANPNMAENLSRWIPSLARAQQTGSVWSNAYPMTDPNEIRNGERIYPGPVLLITSALSYSAADIFIAGFRDHHLGKILGVHANTGAGGANRWIYSDILSLLKGERLTVGRPSVLPGGADLRVAIRRAVRVAAGEGMELEESGIEPDEIHRLTRADLLEGDVDLIAHAVRILRV
ncbi:MAG: S41 family peptidase [Acetobacteraceae bacterium]|nr:S41 family peptidase [Acetobacteraceae bacterium]